MNRSSNCIMSIAALALTSSLPATPAGAASPNQIPIPSTPTIVQAVDPDAADPGASGEYVVRSTILPGTEPAPVMPQAASVRTQSGNYSVNFPNADVHAVAQAILGEILQRNYTFAQGVTGTVTMVTPSPVSRDSLLALFENALLQGNFAMVPLAGGFEIQNTANARGIIASNVTGFGSEIISLKFINVDQVRKVLDAVLPGVVTATDPASLAITISGTTGQRSSARDILQQFDVNWLRNTSFALYVPQRTDSRLITPSLEKLINAPDSPAQGMVRLIAMEQLNGILAISTQPQYLLDIRRWVEILDREGENNERRIFVYRVQNGRARDLTRTINAAYGGAPGGSGGGNNNGDAFADRDPNASNNQSSSSPLSRPSGATPNSGKDKPDNAAGGTMTVRVTADEGNNAVIVLGTPREYALIEDALRKLDISPQQVMIEAAITEVALTDDLRYGVQWNYQSGNSNFGYAQGNTSAPTKIFPGFSYFYGGSSISATLNALQQRTNVKVVSAPKLLVLNNQTAALQVGDQVPISTGSATNLAGSTNSVVSTIEYKDTGVILKITPRVNASGMVQLDVSQEVSQISTSAPAAATQQQSPTISTRRISTTVAVRDGEVIALGGLFSDTKTLGKNGIPFLSQIPVIGGLFGTHRNTNTRTELIVLLKPHVISTPDDARAVTDEFRAKLRTLEPFKSTGQIP